MSGGKKHKPKVHKGAEFLSRAEKDEGFRNVVSSYRESHEIPLGGFTTEARAKKWRLQQKKESKDLRSDYGAILRPYVPITPAMLKLFEDYLLRGSKYNKNLVSSHASYFDIEIQPEDDLKRSLPFVKVKIYAGARRSDVEEFVKERFEIIETIFNLFSDKPLSKRTRSTLNKDRNTLILSLNRLSMPRLRSLAIHMEIEIGRAGRSVVIAKIMQARGHTATIEAVRKTIERSTKNVSPDDSVRRYTK